MRVTSDKQTLILAGEPMPPRRGARPPAVTTASETGSQLQRVTMLLVQREYAPSTLAADSSAAQFAAVGDTERTLLPAAESVEVLSVPAQVLPCSPGALSAGAARYARTQSLSGDGARTALIDTYA